MKEYIPFRTSSSHRPFHPRPNERGHRPKRFELEWLEPRLCLSSTTQDVLAPRLGNSILFHTPSPDDSQSTPRLGTKTPVVVSSEILDLGDGLVVFLTNEAAQHKVLNGDGDKLDNVLQSFDAHTGIVRNSRQAALADSLVDLGDGLVAFLTPERAQGRDLNRDHDKLDLVLQVFDARTGEVRNSRQAAVPGSLVDLGGGLVAFLTPEAAQGRVLNGDGDKLDEVLQSFDFATNTVHNSGQQATAGSTLDIGSGFVAFQTLESAQDHDLNSDTDKLDSVLQTFEPATGVVQNTGQAV